MKPRHPQVIHGAMQEWIVKIDKDPAQAMTRLLALSEEMYVALLEQQRTKLLSQLEDSVRQQLAKKPKPGEVLFFPNNNAG